MQNAEARAPDSFKLNDSKDSLESNDLFIENERLKSRLYKLEAKAKV